MQPAFGLAAPLALNVARYRTVFPTRERIETSERDADRIAAQSREGRDRPG